MSNYFSLEIEAPNGLEGIEEYLTKCKLGFVPWSSNYNGKIILRTKIGSDFEWSMDTSDTDKLFGSGEVFNGITCAVESLESLSDILMNMGLPHIILIDDEHSNLHTEIKYKWNGREIT